MPSSGKITSPNQEKPHTTPQPPYNDKRGTKDTPLIVEMANPPNGDAIAAEIKKNRDDQSTENRRSFIFNTLLMVIGLLQGGALIFTALVSNKAANAAKASADAVVSQLRAYVFVTAARIHGFEQDGPPRLQIRISNRGQTPAYRLTHKHGITYREASVSRFRGDLFPPDEEAPISVATLAPGIIQDAFIDVPLTPEHKATIRNGTHALFAYGEIRYNDAFGKQRTSNYRLMYGDGPPLANDQFTICEEGNTED